jgi:AraC family transcriptional regulator of adaptative response / DNA-3-methyladenine glycosylase II
VARARRTHLARRLLDESDLPMTEIALAAGFSSLRQFNHAMRRSFHATPTELRAPRARRQREPVVGGLVLRLPYRPPLDAAALLGFLAGRAIPGVEHVDGHAYHRTLQLGDVSGTLELRPDANSAHVELRLQAPVLEGLAVLVARARRIFDLDADPVPIAAQLRRSPLLAKRVARRPGLRVPGAFDPFEVAVRAILGQQVSVRGATTLAGRLVLRFGKPLQRPASPALTHVFPSPETLAEADLATVGLPRARADALRGMAAAVASGSLVLDAARGLDDFVARFTALPGIGEWTAQYVAMRACGEPDAFPASDLGLRRSLSRGATLISASAVLEAAEAWRPWRAYAAIHLWTEGDTE